MKVTIEATPNEIAALVLAIQERHEEVTLMFDDAEIRTVIRKAISPIVP